MRKRDVNAKPSSQLKYFWKTRESRREIRRADMRRCYDKKRLWLYNYLLKHPCVDCGEKDPVVLQFDHVRGKKLGEVPKLLAKRSLTIALAEIAKCEVRCANCHLRRHARDKFKYVG